MIRYHVTYYYLATGMEGCADQKDFGIVVAETPDAAKDRVALAEYPTDVLYGPGNQWSTRAFFRGCLTANPVDRPSE